MLPPPGSISWRRRWFRLQRQLQRYNIQAVIIVAGLSLIFLVLRMASSATKLEDRLVSPVDAVHAPRLQIQPTSAIAINPNVEQTRNPGQSDSAIPVLISDPKLTPSFTSEIAFLSNEDKRQAVRSAVLHAWSGYKKDAFGHDELLPLSHSHADNWGALAWTLIDAVGTLFICGLVDEYKVARDFISSMRFDQIDAYVSVFETNIRILGGLLSAFELTGDYMFVEQAKSVGNALMPAFETESGLPTAKINLATGQQSGAWLGFDTVLLSEAGSLQMEFSALSHLTDDPKFMKTAMKVYELFGKTSNGGLLPNQFSLTSGRPLNNDHNLGAYSDSYYEYLLKIYILSDRAVPAALDMYIKATDEMIDKLIVEWNDPETNKRRARIVQRVNGVIENRMEHLTCFIPGMLALGADFGQRYNIESLVKRKDRHMQLATMLLETCLTMYNMTASKLSPEYVDFDNNVARIGDDARYLLRPETVESLFIMHRITKNDDYRDAGWDIFTAIETHCKTDTAYAAVQDVNAKEDPAPKLNNMESFVLAETFKYLYLLFSPETQFPLDHYVFTTEAHPLRIMKGSKIKLLVQD